MVTSTQAEIAVPLDVATLKVPAQSDLNSSGLFLINLVWDQNDLMFLAANDEDWIKWTSVLNVSNSHKLSFMMSYNDNDDDEDYDYDYYSPVASLLHGK